MAGQYIKQANIFGRVGSGVGKGLAEQAPKEIERHRLSSGLQLLGEQKNLTPFQQFAGLAGTPGITPQMIQSGGELLRQQAYLKALENQYQGGQTGNAGKGYVPTQEDLNAPIKGEIPTLSNPESTQESYRNYIPPSEQEERKDAYENFQKNPARYNYEFENALAERKAITTRNQERQKAYQEQEKISTGKEKTVKDALDAEAKRLKIANNVIPPKAYQKFEEKVLNSILPKKEGGEGLTQEQAIKKYSSDLNQVYREYKDLESMSLWSPADFNRRLNALQKGFASREENQQLMDNLISEYGVSPIYAAHRAYPLSNNEKKELNAIPGIGVGGTVLGLPSPQLNNATFEKLKNAMGKTGSPLSTAYELEQKGINPRPWLKYLNDNRDNLTVWQADQLSKNLDIINLNDMWLQTWE